MDGGLALTSHTKIHILRPVCGVGNIILAMVREMLVKSTRSVTCQVTCDFFHY